MLLGYWHSMGGGVANLVASDLVDRGYKDKFCIFNEVDFERINQS